MRSSESNKCKTCLYSKPGHHCKLTRRIPVSLGLLGCAVYIPDEDALAKISDTHIGMLEHDLRKEK